MGFNKWFVPDLQELQKMYSTLGHQEFITFVNKRDAFVGPTDSINFINQILKKEKENVLHRKNQV